VAICCLAESTPAPSPAIPGFAVLVRSSCRRFATAARSGARSLATSAMISWSPLIGVSCRRRKRNCWSYRSGLMARSNAAVSAVVLSTVGITPARSRVIPRTKRLRIALSLLMLSLIAHAARHHWRHCPRSRGHHVSIRSLVATSLATKC